MGFKTIFALSVVGFVVYNAIQRKNSKPAIIVKNHLLNNYNARTIPPFGIFIKASEKNNKALIEHELVHWKQYQEKGLLKFYGQYVNEIKNFGYDKSPMEIQARINETEYCKKNYTECVRSGTSNTITNKNFRA